MSRSAGSLVGPPPPLVDEHGGGGSEWVRLFVARDDIEAHLLIGRLDQADIESRSVKYRGAPSAWLYGGSNPWAPVEILVRRRQLDDARFVLAEISFDVPSQQNPGPKPRRTILWWVTAVVLGLAFAAISLLNVARVTGACPINLLCSPPAVDVRP